MAAIIKEKADREEMAAILRGKEAAARGLHRLLEMEPASGTETLEIKGDFAKGATSWNLGVADDPERYGNGIGVAEESTVIGISGTPVGYYGATPVKLSAVGGAFTGGIIRLALHYLAVSVPGA